MIGHIAGISQEGNKQDNAVLYNKRGYFMPHVLQINFETVKIRKCQTNLHFLEITIYSLGDGFMPYFQVSG